MSIPEAASTEKTSEMTLQRIRSPDADKNVWDDAAYGSRYGVQDLSARRSSTWRQPLDTDIYGCRPSDGA